MASDRAPASADGDGVRFSFVSTGAVPDVPRGDMRRTRLKLFLKVYQTDVGVRFPRSFKLSGIMVGKKIMLRGGGASRVRAHSRSTAADAGSWVHNWVSDG